MDGFCRAYRDVFTLSPEKRIHIRLSSQLPKRNIPQEVHIWNPSAHRPLRYAYLIAFAVTVLAVSLYFVTLLKSELASAYPITVALVYCYILGAVFAFIWPDGYWRLGVVASSGFWLFFGFSFISFLNISELQWRAAIEAIASVAVACLGAYCGRWLALRMKRKPTQEDIS